ncbi:hypothetical protein LTR37_013989 [Vermiconidia calcicola]|uniref:Uncharacterized protein n=1 Tax=Vermiconidia calcicola TaxID=1690605 RepID=A0ACC3MXK2_9PEZI|nr:hypothetical protein LTR37_013989 [Vermiconidia calcicola]
MGVIFLTNDGYSTMCGHATLALGRFLVDRVFDQRSDPRWAGSVFSTQQRHPSTQITFYRDYDLIRGIHITPVRHQRGEALIRLHAPCGVVRVTVPFVEYEDGSSRVDTKRPVSYLSVPSFGTGKSIMIGVAASDSWPEFGQRQHVMVDTAYGGAFYIIVSAIELGFTPAQLASPTKDTLAARNQDAQENLQLQQGPMKAVPGMGRPFRPPVSLRSHRHQPLYHQLARISRRKEAYASSQTSKWIAVPQAPECKLGSHLRTREAN